jgi:hypothetical protein
LFDGFDLFRGDGGEGTGAGGGEVAEIAAGFGVSGVWERREEVVGEPWVDPGDAEVAFGWRGEERVDVGCARGGGPFGVGG